MNAQIKLSSKGQIVIPKDVRDRLRWVQGQPLDIIETTEGVLLTRHKAGSKLSFEEATARIRARIKYDGPPVSIEDMNETINEMYRKSALESDCAKS
jgi:AbrB family looped-hinge helix DNA binding protein